MKNLLKLLINLVGIGGHPTVQFQQKKNKFQKKFIKSDYYNLLYPYI